ncbi:MAG: cytochrome c [Nitrospira sp.]|nr:cytochrome c [Nitrospira sp.]
MKRFILPILILASLLMLTMTQSAWAGAFEPDRPPVAIFKAVCASCHGYDGSGNNGGYTSFVNEEPSFDIRGIAVNKIKNFVRAGFGGSVMPGFNKEEISDSELNALASGINNGTAVGQPDPCSLTLPFGSGTGTQCAATVRIRDEDPWFEPFAVAVPAPLPKQVVFYNAGQTWHTVTQDNFLVSASPTSGLTNSGLVGRGGRYFLDVTTSGDKFYYCMLHPFMQVKICAGASTCSAPSVSTPTPAAAPSAGVGELWVAVQFLDVEAAKPDDTGAAVGPFPDLSATFDDFQKDGELQVINLAALPAVSITRTPSAANNNLNAPHYIWARKGTTEMTINNYFDNYLTFFNASTKAVSLATLTWGTTTSHISGNFNGKLLYGPVQGDYGYQVLRPGANIGSWSVGSLKRITSTDTAGHTGSMPHGIWAGGSNGTVIETANSRTNNATIFSGNNQATCTMGKFPLNAGFNTPGTSFATTNVGNPFTASTSVTLRLGVSGANCGTSSVEISLPGSGAVQTPYSPDDRFIAVSNGPYMSLIDLSGQNFTSCPSAPVLSGGFYRCDVNLNQKGAHGVAWGQRGDASNGWRVYMAGKFTDFVSAVDVLFTGTGPVSVSHAGDIPLITTTTGKNAYAGVANTGGNGVTTRPLPPPWQ